jgi:hypothetical protein
MKITIFSILLVFIFLISCEYEHDPQYSELYYTIIKKNTSANPVFLYEALRKKGAPHVFLQCEKNIPQIYRTIDHIPFQDLEASNAEIITVQIIF